MIILLDTHIALWSMYQDEKLTNKIAAYLTDEDNTVYVSLVSAWEIEIKHSLGRLPVSSDAFLRDCESMDYLILPITKEHIFALSKLPYPENGYKDPFDRLLLASAKAEGMKLLTQDHRVLQYKETCILR